MEDKQKKIIRELQESIGIITVSFTNLQDAICFFRSKLDDNKYLQLVKWNDGYYYVENHFINISKDDNILYTWENNQIFKH